MEAEQEAKQQSYPPASSVRGSCSPAGKAAAGAYTIVLVFVIWFGH